MAAAAQTISRFQSPRPETPEPHVRMGRRNDSESKVQLLDSDGNISERLELCLSHIFAKYCTPQPHVAWSAARQQGLLAPPPDAYLTPAALDKWAIETNGAPFTQETKDELKEYLDTTEQGDLTFKGFLQIYALQTENDEEETWRDLSSHGFDRDLTLVASRREDAEMDEGSPVPMDELQGLGLGGARIDTGEQAA